MPARRVYRVNRKLPFPSPSRADGIADRHDGGRIESLERMATGPPAKRTKHTVNRNPVFLAGGARIACYRLYNWRARLGELANFGHTRAGFTGGVVSKVYDFAKPLPPGRGRRYAGDDVSDADPIRPGAPVEDHPRDRRRAGG